MLQFTKPKSSPGKTKSKLNNALQIIAKRKESESVKKLCCYNVVLSHDLFNFTWFVVPDFLNELKKQKSYIFSHLSEIRGLKRAERHVFDKLIHFVFHKFMF